MKQEISTGEIIVCVIIGFVFGFLGIVARLAFVGCALYGAYLLARHFGWIA